MNTSIYVAPRHKANFDWLRRIRVRDGMTTINPAVGLKLAWLIEEKRQSMKLAGLKEWERNRPPESQQ